MHNRDQQPTSPERDAHEQWEACPQGELHNLVQRLDATQIQSRRRQMLSTAVVSSAVFACVVLALGSVMGPRSNGYGGIRCSECREHFTDYQLHVAGKQISQDADFLASMKTHLEKCTFCRGRFNAAYPDYSVNSAATTRPAITLALQPMFLSHRHAYQRTW